jgi:hypothetical protein
MLFMLALLGIADAAPRHPCTPAADLGPGRYARKSMVVFPVVVDEVLTNVSFDGSAPDGTKLDAQGLIGSVASGLFAVDFPLKRFDGWMTTGAASVTGDTLAATDDALACADAAVIPHVRKAEMEGSGEPGDAKLKLTLELQVFQRRDGVLSLSDTLKAVSPSPLDRVEDVMSAARSKAVGQLKDQMGGKAIKNIKRAKTVVESVAANLPPDQAAKLQTAIEQSELAVTRVASIARPKTVWPQLDRGAHPGELGLAWRSHENACYTEPPEGDHERTVACTVLNRTRQAVRQIQLETRRIPEFRLYGPVASSRPRRATLPLGKEEGLHVGDGYWLRQDTKKVGFARVKRLGIGGEDGSVAPTRLQVVYGRPGLPQVSGREHPQLGIEVAGWGGFLPMVHPAAALPDDPIEGGERALSGATLAPAGALRFDVNLGRMAKMFEWYQTNRIAGTAKGDLMHLNLAFGLERRFLVVPRTYVFAGAAAGFQTWTIPSGLAFADDEGEMKEAMATASRIGPEGEAGVVFLVTPNLLVRAMGGFRYAAPISQFRWAHEEQSGTVSPVVEDGSFALNGTGLVAGLSTAWVF